MKLNKKLLLGLGTSVMIAAPMATVIACGTDSVSKLNITAADFTITPAGEDGIGSATVVWKTTKYTNQADFKVNKITNLSNDEEIIITITPKTGFSLANTGIINATITGLTAATAKDIIVNQDTLENAIFVKGTGLATQADLTLNADGILGVTLSTSSSLIGVSNKDTITITATPNNPLFSVNGSAGAKDIVFKVSVPITSTRDLSQANWDEIKLSEYDLEDWLFNSDKHAFINTVSARMAKVGSPTIISDAQITTTIESQMKSTFDGNTQTITAPALAVEFSKEDMVNSSTDYIEEKSKEIQDFMDSTKAQGLKFMSHVKNTGADDAEFKISLYSINEPDADMTSIMNVFKNDFEFKADILNNGQGAYIANGLLGYNTNGVGGNEDKYSLIQEDVTLQGNAGTSSNPYDDRYVEDSMVVWNSFGPVAGKKAAVKAALYTVDQTDTSSVKGDIDTYVGARYIIDRNTNIPTLKLDVYRVQMTGTSSTDFIVLGTDTLYLENELIAKFDTTPFDAEKQAEFKTFMKDKFNFITYYEVVDILDGLLSLAALGPQYSNIKSQVLNFNAKLKQFAAVSKNITSDDFIDKLITRISNSTSYNANSLLRGLEIYSVKHFSYPPRNAGTKTHALYYWLNIISTEISVLINEEITAGNITPEVVGNVDDFYESLLAAKIVSGKFFNDWEPEPGSLSGTIVNWTLPNTKPKNTIYQYKIGDGEWKDVTGSSLYISTIAAGVNIIHVRVVAAEGTSVSWEPGTEPADKQYTVTITNSLPWLYPPTKSFDGNKVVGGFGSSPTLLIANNGINSTTTKQSIEDAFNMTDSNEIEGYRNIEFIWDNEFDKTAPGTYTVTATAIDSTGARSASKTLAVTVINNDRPTLTVDVATALPGGINLTPDAETSGKYLLDAPLNGALTEADLIGAVSLTLGSDQTLTNSDIAASWDPSYRPLDMTKANTYKLSLTITDAKGGTDSVVIWVTVA